MGRALLWYVSCSAPVSMRALLRIFGQLCFYGGVAAVGFGLFQAMRERRGVESVETAFIVGIGAVAAALGMLIGFLLRRTREKNGLLGL